VNANLILFCGMISILAIAGTASGYGVVRCPVEAGILKLDLPECWTPKDVTQDGERIWVGDPKEITGGLITEGPVGTERHSVWIVGNMNNTEEINNETLRKRWDYFVNNETPSISITIPGSSEEDFLAYTQSYETGRDAAGNLYALGLIRPNGRHPWDLFGIKMIDKNKDGRMDACIVMIAVEKIRFAQEMMQNVILEQS